MVYRARMVVPAKAGTHGTVAWNYQNAGAPAAVGNEIGGLGLLLLEDGLDHRWVGG
jgi:hypothetical protein